MSSQKTPDIPVGFTVAGTETNVNKVIKKLTDKLNGIALEISFYGICERRVRQDGTVYPALFQSNSKDWIDAMANDQWPGYGFWDLEDPEKWEYTGDGTVLNYGKITRKASLIVYGHIDKLLWKDGETSTDYRYDKQLIKSQIIEILLRHTSAINGYFELNEVFDQEIENIFKGFTAKEQTGQFLQSPNFGFRFSGLIITDEECV
jgi:hypothetical protein